MANNNKETERAELHKTIWRIANDLRGSVDGWDFKTYVLGMLFYRFISENLTSYLNEQERKAGSPDFDYARLSDADAEFGRAETVKEKGFYILPSELFARSGRSPQKASSVCSLAPIASSSVVNSQPPRIPRPDSVWPFSFPSAHPRRADSAGLARVRWLS